MLRYHVAVSLASTIKQRALEIGFDLAGIAPVGAWRELEFSRQWVEQGRGGEMRYLANPKRDDPRLILPSVKSVICVGLVYNAPLPYSEEFRRQESGVRRKSSVVSSQLSVARKKSSVVSSQLSVAENQGTNNKQTTAAFGQLAADNGPRTTDHEQRRVSSFEFRVSNFQFPVSDGPRAWISRYAWGHDYHEVMRARLEALRAALEELAPGAETRVYVDTGPIVERAFARLSGIGWTGKNTCLINEQKGSWFFLGVMLTSLELEPDLPAPDRCGSCTACLEACPTGALVEPYVMDASRCIAYFNIELKGSIPEEFRPAIGLNVIGCDICQDVCPWNGKGSRPLSVVSSQSETESHQLSAVSRQSGRKAATTTQPEFQPLQIQIGKENRSSGAQVQTEVTGQLTIDQGLPTTDNGQLTTDNERRTAERVSNFDFPVSGSRFPVSLFHPPLEVLAAISEDDFRRLFAHSPIKRVKYRGWLRNLAVVMGNSGDRRFIPWLERAAEHSDEIVREHATWALRRLTKE